MSEKLLAILGGKKAVTSEVFDSTRWPINSDEEVAAAEAVIRSGRLTDLNEIAQFEAEFRQWVGCEYALAHCNGTAALHAALFAVGVGPGDEVIVQSATFWASVTAILHCGGIPVFADIDETSHGLDPEDVKRHISPRTKAIIVVHLWGMPSRMDELVQIAKQNGLMIIEDASHAHGARYLGKSIGTLGDIGVFSLQTTKLLPAGEGGMLVTDRRDLWERALLLGHYNRLSGSQFERFGGTGYGLNYRISTINSAIGRVQLRKFGDLNQIRNHNMIYLSHRLEQMGVKTYLAPEGVDRVYYEFHISLGQDLSHLLKPIILALRVEGVQALQPRYPLVHQQPLFQNGNWKEVARLSSSETKSYDYSMVKLPVTGRLLGNLIRLPIFTVQCESILDQYVLAFEKVIGHFQREVQKEGSRL